MILGAVIAVAIGCSSSTDALTTGGLHITVTGLPGAPAAITVTGPTHFTASVTATTTLSALEPGLYTIAAASVSVASATYSPAAETTIVVVDPSRTPSEGSVSYALEGPVATVTIPPTPGPVYVGTSAQYRATARDALGKALHGPSVAWSSDNAASATVSATGLVTGVAVGIAMVKATSQGVSDSVTAVTVAVPITIHVTPCCADTVVLGSHQQFIATLANDPSSLGITWLLMVPSIDGDILCHVYGTVSPSRSASGSAITYTPPHRLPAIRQVHLIAQSAVDLTKVDSVRIDLTSDIEVNLTPVGDTSMKVSTSLRLTAPVTNDASNAGVSWSLENSTGCLGVDCGTLSDTASASGVAITYSAPATVPNPATIFVTAASVTDDRHHAVDSITIRP